MILPAVVGGLSRYRASGPSVAALCVLGALLCTSHLTSLAANAPSALAPGQGVSPAVVQEFDTDRLEALLLQFNPLLKATAQSVDAARASVTSAGALLNPRVDWSRGPWQPQGASAASSQSWTLTQPIENPQIRRARIDSAKAGEKSAEQQLALLRNDLLAQLRMRIFEAMLHQGEAEAAAESLTLLEQVQQRVRVRVSSGEAPRYELIKADSEVINARERQQTAALRADKTLLEISRLVAGQLPARWKLKPPTAAERAMTLTLEQLQASANQFNPEILTLKHEFDRAQSRLVAVRASVLPSVDLRYSQMTDPQVRQSQWGIGVQIPLLDQRSGPIAEAVAELERARLRYEGRQAEMTQQVLLAWRSLEMSRLRVDALSQGVVREAESALRVAEAAYRFGERGILDVLDAQRVLRSVRADLLQARFQLQVARITLLQLSGRYASDSNLSQK
ncbi:MAG: TolC family protein [Limnohabitans sp.]|uniref:TolC family protein n=1 Tax=Limnohabitans sp. TaxID=1907725 RepID=UPI0025DFEC0B|nr:TolC family protein [Limnohabitans sp.]MCO4090011.1 TolC family protein [Limnohabitans sp.]